VADTHKVIYIARDAEQAHLLKNILFEQGIFAYVTGDSLRIGEGELPMGLATAPRVVVDQANAERARRLALDFDQQFHRNVPSEDADELQVDPEELTDWPNCPHCNRPRHTSCPICETAGTSFPPAFDPPVETDGGTVAAGHQLRVLCPICDEPFVPRFPSRCEWCGHRFRDGYELPPPEPLITPLEINGRAWIVLAVIVFLVGGTLLMFMHIARQASP
jgi:hypothetical protein